MPRGDRKALIDGIETMRESRVIVYVTGDRAPAPAQMGDDAVRPLYDHLRAIGHQPKLDLFVYSRGGAIDVPWRIATAMRSASDTWNVLVPFRANSAAALLALGADQIVWGKQGELGPIDPQVNIQKQVFPPNGPPTAVQETLSVEDVMAYERFATERAGLSDQTALTESLAKLTDRLDAVSLGNLYRTHTHIREVARRMLLSRKKPPKEQQTARIIETLAERVYAHGHAIGYKEADEIGLPCIKAPDDLDDAMWELLQVYESDLHLLEPFDPFDALSAAGADKHREPWPSAAIESTEAVHEFVGELEVTAKRQVPQNLTVNVDVPINLPPGVDLNQLPQQVQQLLQQLLQAAQQGAQQAAVQGVEQALQQQAPLVGVEAALRSPKWQRGA